MRKSEMSEIFAKKMSSVFARSSPTFAKKPRLAKSNANLIGYEQTTHVRSRSSIRAVWCGVGARAKPNQTAALTEK